VSLWSQSPGATKSCANLLLAYLAESLRYSYERPAINGRSARRIKRLLAKSGCLGINVYTRMLITNTINMKLVPHRG